MTMMEENIYLAMELIEGETLQQRVENQGPLTGALLWFTAQGLVEALKAIHDLKLENEIKLCSLAKKNEELFIPNVKNSLDCNKENAAILLKIQKYILHLLYKFVKSTTL